jgi:hypothetical protein
MAARDMKSVYTSAAIGLTIGTGPAIIGRLMPRIGILDQLGAVILGLIIGMQAASRRRTRYDRRGPRRSYRARRAARQPTVEQRGFLTVHNREAQYTHLP